MQELIVLGTAGEQPNRLRVAGGALLVGRDGAMLLDPGEGCLKQLVLLGLLAADTRRVFISHFHLDHCQGLPSVLEALDIGPDRSIEIFYPAQSEPMLDHLLALAGPGRGVGIVRRPLVDGARERVDAQTSLVARALDHDVETLGIRLETLSGETLAFVMDTLPCSAAEDLARGVDHLVCQASDQHRRAEQVHRRKLMTATDAAELARASGARQLLLTHFQPGLAEVNALLHEARAIFPAADVARDLTSYGLFSSSAAA